MLLKRHKFFTIITLSICVVVIVYIVNSRTTSDFRVEINRSVFSREASDLNKHRVDNGKENHPTKKTGKNLTPAEAEAMLLSARTIKDIQERSVACAKIIQNLCESGYANEAFLLIDSESGRVRNAQVNYFFYYSKLPISEIINKLKSLPYTNEATSAMESYIDSSDTISPQNLTAVLATPEFKEITKILEANNPGAKVINNLFASYLRNKLSDATTSDARSVVYNAAQNLYSEGKISDQAFVSVVNSDKNLTSFDKWDIINKSQIQSSASDVTVNKARTQIIAEMVDQDAEKTLRTLTANDSSQGNAPIETAMQRWISNDGASAKQWFESNISNLNNDKKNAMREAFFQKALSYGEKDGAEQWANQISDQVLREKLLQNLGTQK